MIGEITDAKISIRIYVENSETHDGEHITINDYPEEEILTYLSTCRIRRCLFPDYRKTGPSDEQKLNILIISGDDHISIFLADTNYVDTGEIFKYKVINVDTVTKTLMDMIDYNSYTIK